MRLEGRRSGFQDPNEFKSFAPTGEGTRALGNALDKMLAGRAERLRLLDTRDVTIAVVIGILEFRKRVVVWRSLDADVVDTDLLMRLQVVVNDHAPRPDDGHFPHLARLQPAALNRGKALV